MYDTFFKNENENEKILSNIVTAFKIDRKEINSVTIENSDIKIVFNTRVDENLYLKICETQINLQYDYDNNVNIGSTEVYNSEYDTRLKLWGTTELPVLKITGRNADYLFNMALKDQLESIGETNRPPQ